MSKRGYRTGSISKEDAIKRFHEYYNNRSKSPIARLRAKMFDMMYQKKPKYTLRPGEPGSEKYLLEEGPRTFDMIGVDSFKEGQQIIVENEGTYSGHTAVSKGATFKKKDDRVQNIIRDEDGNERSPEIYGPRINDSGELYNTHFKKTYADRKNLPESDPSNLNNKNIVDKYWDLYRNDPDKYKRKNKKVGRDSFSFSFMSYNSDNLCTINNNDVENVIVDGLVEPIDETDILYLKKLKILTTNNGNLELNKKLIKHNLFKIIIDTNPLDDDEELEELLLDTDSSKLYYLENCDYTNMSLNNYLSLFNGNLDNILEAIPDDLCLGKIDKTTKKETIRMVSNIRTPADLPSSVESIGSQIVENILDDPLVKSSRDEEEDQIEESPIVEQVPSTIDLLQGTSVSLTDDELREKSVSSEIDIIEDTGRAEDKVLDDLSEIDVSSDIGMQEDRLSNIENIDTSPELIADDDSVTSSLTVTSSDGESIEVDQIRIIEDSFINSKILPKNTILFLDTDTSKLYNSDYEEIGIIDDTIQYEILEPESSAYEDDEDDEIDNLLIDLEDSGEKDKLKSELKKTGMDPTLADEVDLSD